MASRDHQFYYRRRIVVLKLVLKSELRCLVSWIGHQDLEGVAAEPATRPIVDFMRVHSGIQAFLLSDWPEREQHVYSTSLRRITRCDSEVRTVKLADPTDYLAVYRYATHYFLM